jgi:riboflavin kinase/FMN adenylyltransferase
LAGPLWEKVISTGDHGTEGNKPEMNFRQLLGGPAPDKDTVVTLGVFDGVHLGHRHLLRRVVELSQPSFLPTVLTFSNHPITVLRPGTQVAHLTTVEKKIELLEEQGIELVLTLEFTSELSRVSARDFAAMLVESLRMKGLVMGPDTALGHNREGDYEFLQRQGQELGFWVEVVEPFAVDGVTVKSRRIREDIAGGNVEASTKLLSRNYSLSGQVVVGDRRGKQLGFPTANLEIDQQLMLPGDGIYATWAIIDGVRHPSATSVGVRPTFGLTERLVEVHVIDLDSDLYGQRMFVEFVSKLRDQETFANIETLVQQIEQDVADSRVALA